jgi:hypothetical protein
MRQDLKTWMPGTTPGMTGAVGVKSIHVSSVAIGSFDAKTPAPADDVMSAIALIADEGAATAPDLWRLAAPNRPQ